MNQTQQRNCFRELHLVVLYWMLCILPVPVMASESDNQQAQVVITAIIVNRSNVFDTPGSAQSDTNSQLPGSSLIAGNVNRFHKVTLESVILREAGIRPGDTISVADVAETERRLRNLGIFASVSANLVTGENGVELHIATRDNFSLVAGLSGSFLGGIGNIGFTAGDKNLLGTGNRLTFRLSRTTEDDFLGSVILSDLHFFEKPWRAEYRIGRTDEGDFFSFGLNDPFQSLSDRRAWAIAADNTEENTTFYSGGFSVIEVPEDRVRIAGSHVWRSGTQDLYFRKGLVGSVTQIDYAAAQGVNAEEITVPEDRRTIYAGGLLGLDRITEFKKVRGIDTLTFTQDLRLGGTAEVQFGADFIEDFNAADTNSRTEPVIALVLRQSAAIGEHSLVSASFRGNAEFEEDGVRPWNGTVSFRAFNTALKNTTLAFNTDFSTGVDGNDLPIQFTLGEDSGLRGYDARQFEGRQRWRLNLESRYSPGWKLSFLDIGLVGFFDAGFAAERSESSPTIRRSIGAGLRLGSNTLLGPRVMRVDVAVPLDTPAGDSSDPRLSIAVGQVFRF